MVTILNHIASVQKPTQQKVGSTVTTSGYEGAVSVTCLIQPASISDQYGAEGPDLDGKYLLICSRDYADLFSVPGCLVSWAGKQFRSSARAKDFQTGIPEADHLEVMLDQQQFPEVVG